MRKTTDRKLFARPTVEFVRASGGYQHIVIVVPGIRSNADWVDLSETETWKNWQRERLANPPLEYRKASDGRISTWRLISRAGLQNICDNIQSQIELVIDQNPDIKISIICHSLGSDILMKILPKIDYKFDHIVILGSVCKKSLVFTIRNCARKFVNGRGTCDQWPIAASVIRPDKYEPTGTFGFGLAFVRELVSNNDHHSCTSVKYIVSDIEEYIHTGRFFLDQSLIFPYSVNYFTYTRNFTYAWISISLIVALIFSVKISAAMFLFLVIFMIFFLWPTKPRS